jgi:nucleotide-binding universal stress UspA family protein
VVKVLIATDGSDLALDAARRGAALLAATEAVVLVVPSSMPGEDAGGIEGSREAQAEIEADVEADVEADLADAQAAVDAVVAALPDALRTAARVRIEAGDPGPMIVWVAEDERCDVIVVGSHGKGALKRVLMGSVSEHVMRHAPCPVMVVRARDLP